MTPDCPTPRPHLSPTSLTMLARCAKQFEYRYVHNVIAPPGVSLLKGRAVHKAAEVNLRHRMQCGTLLDNDAVDTAAREALAEYWREGPELTGDELLMGPDTTRERALESCGFMARFHNITIAPLLEPVHVERECRLSIPSLSHDLECHIDVQEAGAIRDLKTAARKPAEDAADVSIQLTAYALAVNVIDGKPPHVVSLDYLVSEGMGMHIRLNSTRNQKHYAALYERMEHATKMIAAGAFPPCLPESFHCSPMYCGYYGRCPHGMRKRVTI